MGRSNYAILVLGFAGTVILSLCMKHVLQVAQEHQWSPVGAEIVARFGERLDGEVSVRLQPSSRGPRAAVRIQPIPGESLRKVAYEVGEYVWTRLEASEGIVGVDVVCRPWASGGPLRFDVPRPVPTRRRRPRIALPTSRPAAPAPPPVVDPAPPTNDG